MRPTLVDAGQPELPAYQIDELDLQALDARIARRQQMPEFSEASVWPQVSAAAAAAEVSKRLASLLAEARDARIALAAVRVRRSATQGRLKPALITLALLSGALATLAAL